MKVMPLRAFLFFTLGIILFHGVNGQTIFVKAGGVATFTDMTVPSTGGSSLTNAAGQTLLKFDIFGGPTVESAFKARVKVTKFQNGFREVVLSFTISNVQRSDAGSFQCTSQFEGTRPCGATLIVLGPPTKPTLTVETKPVVVGSDVTVLCRASSTSTPVTTELRLVYNLKENGVYALKTPNTSTRFKITGVTKAKKGTRYTCVAFEQNIGTSQLTGLQSADSDVYIMDPLYPPDNPHLNPPQTSYSVSTNSPLPDITCIADCNPLCTFSWFKESQLILAREAVLRLGSAAKSEAGKYFCRAENTQGSQNVPFSITVQDSLGRVELIPPINNYTIKEGTQLEDITCRANCTPACSFSWLKNGQDYQVKPIISLGQVSVSDAGTYKCTASNGQNRTEVSFVLDVQYPPKIPASRALITPASSTYQGSEGAVVLADIICAADCNPTCTYKWTKDGGQSAKSGAVLSLGTATRDDTGLHTCTATNPLGNITVSVKVTVHYKPETITFQPPDSEYGVIKDAVIPNVTCSANCFPVCQYEWYKDNNPTPISTSSVLSLGAARINTAGLYSCRAVNSLDSIRKDFAVTVKYGPQSVILDPPKSSFTLPSGTLMPSVTCSANCNPECSYKWVKDDSATPLTTSRALNIGQVDQGQAGIYKCISENEFGNASSKFVLSVQFGPSSTITLNPPKDVHDLIEGNNLTVSCSAVCDPQCSFQWVHNSGKVVSGNATLKLTDVTRTDAGQYTCIADNKVGTPARRAVTVSLLIGPSGRVKITPPGPLTIRQGNSVVLTCSADCLPACSYKWMKNSMQLQSVSGILTLNDVNRNTDGSYICEASNVAGNGTKDVVLEVQYGPGDSIVFEPSKSLMAYPVEENRTLSVTCTADCKPQCTFKWTKDSLDVVTGPRLFLESAQRDQAGTYLCIADNVVRQPANKQLTVDVLFSPGEITMFPDAQVLYPVRGSFVSVKCWAKCNPACRYEWFKGSSKLASSNGELQLVNVTTASTGEYTCVANNAVGSPSTRIVNISVRAGPGTTVRFNPPEDTDVVVEGKRLTVECIAECFPPCTYKWQKGSRLITETAVLNIPSINRTHAGSYICYASNDGDSQGSKPLTIEVQYGPSQSVNLFPPGLNQTYFEGSPFNIKCSADCNPPCSYKWFLGSKLLPFTDGVLLSDGANQNQSGFYSCQASNGIGSASSVNLMISVQTGPGSTLTFVPPGNRQVVREGTDLLVTCSADCSPACRYKWTLNGEEISTQGGKLALTSITRDMKGAYTCLAGNGNGNQGTKQLTVDVQYGPGGTIEVFPGNQTQVLNEGASVSIKCSADCNPSCSYTWHHGSNIITTSGGVLTLISVGPENGGAYRCSARNSIGFESSSDLSVIVKTGPGSTVKIEPEGDIYGINEGHELRMKCSAVCSPPCTYTWHFGLERVKASNGILIKPNISRSQSGPYFCYAVNDVGIQGSRQIQVDVMYGPVDGVMLDPANNISLETDNSFALRCSANCRPQCNYVWFLGPHRLTTEGGKLSISRASEANIGTYTCQASNSVESAVSQPVSVDVLYGPRDTIVLDPPGTVQNFVEGTNVMVTCSAKCRPVCSYTWYAGSKILDSTNGVLSIPMFNRSMPRYYTCFADNRVSNRAMTSLQIIVQYGPGGKLILFPDTSPITATVGSSVSVQCSAQCSPECSYFWSRNNQNVSSPSPGILQLKNLQPDQEGTYICSASNGIGSSVQSSVVIQLLSGPGASIHFIPPDLNTAVTENGTLRVMCVAECVPDCSLTWTRSGKLVSSQGLLELTNTQRDQAGVYQCNAKNNLGINVTQLLMVVVEYGPKGSTRLFPPEGFRNINQGDTLTVQCTASCLPPCTYTWKKGEQELSTEDGVLILPNVSPNDDGRYTCMANNGRGPEEDVNLTVSVNFGPDDSIKFEPPGDITSVLEGKTLVIRCMAKCLPACSYSWYFGSRRMNSNDGLLSLPSFNRQDAGNYTCLADNGLGKRISKELYVDVEFLPSAITFDPMTTSYTIRERIDSISDIRCYADCNPRCNVSWMKNGEHLQTTGSVLAFSTPDRSADAIYTCLASNPHGSRSKDLTITVNYAPSVTVFTINDNKTVAIVSEKSPVTLDCRVSSKPPSTIQLFNGSTLLSEQQKTLQAKYSWKQADCLDAAVYTCTADNEVGALVSLMTELRVQCIPRLDPRVFKWPFVASDIGNTATISVPVLADPAPSFTWYKVRDGVPSIFIPNINETQGLSDKFFTVNGLTTTLTIQNIQLTDYGDYVVSIANEKGIKNITFSLVPKSVPYQARDLSAHAIDAHTVEITWSPGFNGGAKQQFLLDYLKQGTNGWRTLALDSKLNDATTSIRVNVSDLNPSTPYIFRVRSRNMYGYSNYSNDVQVVTDATSMDSLVASGEVNPMPVLLGVGLALGFLVGAGITAIVIVSRCRSKPTKHGENLDDFHSDSTYDTLYLRDALWAQRHIKMNSIGSKKGSSDYHYDGYDLKQPEDTMKEYDYSSYPKTSKEMRTSL